MTSKNDAKPDTFNEIRFGFTFTQIVRYDTLLIMDAKEMMLTIKTIDFEEMDVKDEV